MKHITGWILLFALVAACGADAPAPTEPEKPEADPDQTVGEKADRLSNYWTDVVGDLADGEEINGAIGYPSWFHGYTMELEAGAELSFQLGASAEGHVRLYGPSWGNWNGAPYFGSSIVQEYVTPDENVEFVYEVTEPGTYMIVYGPRYVWSATYTIDLQSVGVPSCNDDSECGSDEYCGDNGVRCITFPCDANFDICKPRELEGAYCANDRGCADGLSCQANTCAVAQNECSDATDCSDQFCGWDADTNRVCKDYAFEGDRCGGFVRPQDYQICEPSFGCLAPDFIADIPGWCGTEVTVADLMNDSATYDERFVGLKGYIGLGLAACTRMACPADDACCNRCSGAQLLYDDAVDNNSGSGIRLFENGENFSCSGDECNITETCTTDEGIYWVGGVFHADPNGGGTIEVVRKMQGF